MNATAPLTTAPLTTDGQHDRNRKRKAVLAGGVVLGLGAAMTLAAWSSDVFSNGEFATGTFQLQADVYGAPAAGYESEGDGDMSFQVAPLNMAPGDTLYAPISIATSLETTTGAEVTLLGPEFSEDEDEEKTLVEALSYEVRTIGAEEPCDADAFSREIIAGSWTHVATDLTASPTETFTVGAAQESPQHLCFAVTLPEAGTGAMQGQSTGPVVWQFQGESVPATAPVTAE